MAFKSQDRGQMILLAGILLVMAYLVFSTQTALLATVGQEAGREATSPLFVDFLGVRAGIAEQIDDELTDSGGVIRCPALNSNYQGRVDAILVMITQLQSNRGLSFHGTFLELRYADVNPDTDPPAPAPPVVDNDEMLTTISLYLSDGDASILEEVVYYTNCVGPPGQ